MNKFIKATTVGDEVQVVINPSHISYMYPKSPNSTHTVILVNDGSIMAEVVESVEQLLAQIYGV